MSNAISLKEFNDMMDKHDWSYRFSDDISVLRRGERQWAAIQIAAATSTTHEKLLALWQLYWNSHVNRKPVEKPDFEAFIESEHLVDSADNFGLPAEALPEEETPEETAAVETRHNSDDLSERQEIAYVEGKPFYSGAEHSNTLDSAKAYLQKREGDLLKLKAMLWDNNNSIAPGWELRRYANSPQYVVCSLKDEDVNWAKDFDTKEQALAYILARWW